MNQNTLDEMAVRFSAVSKSFGGERVLEGVNLSIPRGRYSVLLGGPASGKSTLLRLLMGLEKLDEGTISLRGEAVATLAPGARNIGYVPQSFALYPHYSVYDNIAYPLKLARTSRPTIAAAVHKAAEQLGIDALLRQSPDQLSGGQKQRVAIARGIVKDTDIFILDDPLTGLDFKLREQLFDDFRAMQSELGATFIHATSDTLEAQMLATDIHVLDGGRIVEAGDFETVFEYPQHVRSMALLGFPKANLLPASRQKNTLTTPCFELAVDELADTVAAGDELLVAIRPQHLQVTRRGAEATDNTIGNTPVAGERIRIDAELTLIENLGGEFVAYLLAEGLMLSAVLRHDELQNLVEGPVQVSFARQHAVFYDAHSGQRIPERLDSHHG